ncbi:hypothetical protein Mapa_015572 [Marchantia paleacea]|nr:hypothetical protein Mapa_015572 [Marchantia paleacea]
MAPATTVEACNTSTGLVGSRPHHLARELASCSWACNPSMITLMVWSLDLLMSPSYFSLLKLKKFSDI